MYLYKYLYHQFISILDMDSDIDIEMCIKENWHVEILKNIGLNLDQFNAILQTFAEHLLCTLLC